MIFIFTGAYWLWRVKAEVGRPSGGYCNDPSDNDGGLDVGTSCGDGEKWFSSQHALKTEPARCIHD